MSHSLYYADYIMYKYCVYIDSLLDIVCPAGASLALGKLIIRIYKGEDFPQLDSRKTSIRKGSATEDLVDPYCVVSYGGHKAKTPVIRNNYDPEWNYEISLPFQVRITPKSN